MAHGVTVLMRNMVKPEPQVLHENWWGSDSYVNKNKDRSLRGKKRRKAVREARRS